MGHQGLQLMPVVTPDGRFMGDLGLGMGNADDRNRLCHGTVANDLHAIHMAPGTGGVPLGDSGYLGQGVARAGDPGCWQRTALYDNDSAMQAVSNRGRTSGCPKILMFYLLDLSGHRRTISIKINVLL